MGIFRVFFGSKDVKYDSKKGRWRNPKRKSTRGKVKGKFSPVSVTTSGYKNVRGIM